MSVNSASAIRQIYSRKANVQKGDWFRTLYAAAKAPTVHSETDKVKRGFRRRIIEHVFSDAALRSSEVFILENIQTFCEKISETATNRGEWGKSMDMNHWSIYFHYDIMGDLTFGTRFNCMGSEEHRYVPSLMMSSGQFLYYFGYLPFTKLVRPLILSKILEVFGGKLNDPNYLRKDFMHYLINRKDLETDKGLSREELAAESSLLIAAGSDTTAVAFSGAIFYFLCYLECLTKAITEVRSTFNSIEDIRGSNMVNLVYLRACVDEALRLAPPQTI
ncbi:hypothetical protein MauCBS54593_002505 [Microsporum audouinii]